MILVLDEERGIHMYADEMKRIGLPVRLFRDVDTAWSFLKTTRKPLDIAVLDIMLPHGRLFTREETEEGLYTGLSFYRLLRKDGFTCPVFLLTNLTNPRVSNETENDPSASVHIKSDLFYDELAAMVQTAYKTVRRNAEGESH